MPLLNLELSDFYEGEFQTVEVLDPRREGWARFRGHKIIRMQYDGQHELPLNTLVLEIRPKHLRYLPNRASGGIVTKYGGQWYKDVELDDPDAVQKMEQFFRENGLKEESHNGQGT